MRRTAIHYQAHCRTLQHTVPHIAARTRAAHRVAEPRALTRTAAEPHRAVCTRATHYYYQAGHCRALCAHFRVHFHTTLPHTDAHCRTAGQPHTTLPYIHYQANCCILLSCARTTALCHKLPLALPHITAKLPRAPPQCRTLLPHCRTLLQYTLPRAAAILPEQ
jgi:hypothetical protein